MAAILDADVSIDASGNIRWTGAATTNRHSVLEFIQWLQDKQDDGQAAGDDLLDITVDTPFDRSTDQIVTLNSPFNIDDTFATHLYDGSVTQTSAGGETRYSGLEVLGPVEAGTEYLILQAGNVLPAFWGTGINAPGGASLVFSRHLVKSKEGGSLIDGGRIVVLARDLGDQYRRFPVTLGTGNSVAAIGNGADIFNTTVEATIEGWTIVNTEGFQELNIDGSGAAGQEFYSQWDKGTQTINDTYEYTKWIAQRGHIADQTGGTPTGANFIIDNATITGQAQSFIPNTSPETENLTEARFQIKIGGGTPTGTIYAELYDSDDVATAAPTGAALARSEDVLASAITSTYEEVIFRFNRKDPTGTISAQSTQLDLINAEYFIALRHDAGTAGDFFHVEGASTDQDATQNRAEDAAGWTGSATSDLNLIVKSSPVIHGISGEAFEGISAEVFYDTETGTGVAENQIVNWGTELVIDTAVGTFIEGEHVNIKADGGSVIKNGGQLLYTNGTTAMVLALDNITSNLLDNDDITGVVSGATAKINVTITNQDKAGGTGLVLAKDDNGTAGEIYVQLITGVNPVDNSRIYAPGAVANYVDAATTINSRTLNPEFLGTSTGSNIIGAYGIGFDPADVGASDRFTSLDNTSRVPPNNVVFTVSGLVSGEDRVLVGPRTGTALDRGQWLVNTALTTNAETALVVKTGTDTVPWASNTINWPATGIGVDASRLRIERNDGIYKRVPYDSHNSSNTFTLGTPATGTINIEVSQVGGTGGQFDRISAGSFLDDGFENGCRFTGAGFTNAGNNATFTALSVTATTIVVVDDTGMVNESAGGGNETLTSNGWDFSVATAGMDSAAVDNDAFILFIDVLADASTETFTGVHGGVDRNLFVRVRDGGTAGDGIPTKTFEATAAQFLSTPQTVAAVRTADA